MKEALYMYANRCINRIHNTILIDLRPEPDVQTEQDGEQKRAERELPTAWALTSGR